MLDGRTLQNNVYIIKKSAWEYAARSFLPDKINVNVEKSVKYAEWRGRVSF